MDTILLNKSQIESLVTMAEVVDMCDKTFQGFGDGTTLNPAKVNLCLGDSDPYPPYHASMNAMPAYIGFEDMAGLKWAGGFAGGRMKHGKPFLNAMILLCHPDEGDFLAVMDGTWITNMRTGGQTAAALRYILKDRKSVKVGLYGAGKQARTQTMAIAACFDIEELRVYDIVPESAAAFKEEMASFVKGDIVICEDPAKVAEMEVVVSVTIANNAFIKHEWFHDGSIYFAMGSYQECDYETLLGADRIIVDHVQQCLHRGALKKLHDEGRLGEENIYCTIGELAVGRASASDTAGKLTVVIPIGTGAMDVAVAGLVYQRAVEKGIGTSFAFDA